MQDPLPQAVAGLGGLGVEGARHVVVVQGPGQPVGGVGAEERREG